MHLPWRPVRVTPDGPPILTSVTEAESRYLVELATGKQVLEIGSAYGYSTVLLALAAEDVVAVDPHHDHNSHEILLNYLTQYRVTDKVDVHRATSQTVMPALLAEGYAFDLIFIDGDHRTAGVAHDIEWALKLISPGGAIAVHDVEETCCCPEVKPMADLLLGTYELVDTMAVAVIS